MLHEVRTCGPHGSAGQQAHACLLEMNPTAGQFWETSGAIEGSLGIAALPAASPLPRAAGSRSLMHPRRATLLWPLMGAAPRRPAAGAEPRNRTCVRVSANAGRHAGTWPGVRRSAWGRRGPWSRLCRLCRRSLWGRWNIRSRPVHQLAGPCRAGAMRLPEATWSPDARRGAGACRGGASLQGVLRWTG